MPRFFVEQYRRLSLGIVIGSVLAAILHFLFWDPVFISAIRLKWANLSFNKQFGGFGSYRVELFGLIVGLAAVILLPGISLGRRYMRSWWAGITSAMTLLSAAVTVVVLWLGAEHIGRTVVVAFAVIGTLVAAEHWRHKSRPLYYIPKELKLNIPAPMSNSATAKGWEARSSDDPINDWHEDIIGRTAVVELLAEHALRLRTPVIALQGGFGDGKSSVLNLLRKAVQGHAIVVSFSAWLPGSEVTLATDLFKDIANECRNVIYVPQLRRRALAYARTVTASVSYLAGLKEMLPTLSQREEIDELRETIARVPLPIVVLLDEVDRMQKDEILVLLKILRGIASFANVTFVCAFNQEELKRELSNEGQLSYDYLEKFSCDHQSLSARPGYAR